MLVSTTITCTSLLTAEENFCVHVCTCVCISGHGEELLSYWKLLDRSLNVMAAQYYTKLRTIEEREDGEREREGERKKEGGREGGKGWKERQRGCV